MRAFAIAALAITGAATLPAAHALGCKDENGGSVDWWAAFKFQDSFNYAYIDSNAYGGLERSSHSMDSPSSGALAHTLSQLWDSVNTYGFYNDEPPNGSKASSTYGHTKGAFGLSGSSGFWLIHSTPRFPDNTGSSYSGMPVDEEKYGQSFLCVSYGASEFDKIGQLFQYNRPKFYATQSGSDAPSNLAAALSGTYDHNADIMHTGLTSSNGASFTNFGKTEKWGQDLYNQGVSEYFGVNTYVESWMNGVGPLPTYCKPSYNYDTFDIRVMNITNNIMKETQDHSKWAITESGYTVCIGDINRQHGQLGRPGGTSCFRHEELWHSLQGGIVQADTC